MPPSTEGHAIAIARIADEKKNRTGFLDLGELGLTDVPQELFELEHLRGLYWGTRRVEESEGWYSVAPNSHAGLLLALHRFPGLTLVSVSQTDVSDLAPLAALHSLQSLDCSGTQVSDLTPLAALQSLQSFDCSDTQVSDLASLGCSPISPVARLP